MKRLAPESIILIKADVYDAAYHALAKAKLPVIPVRMPFPGSGRLRQFAEAFARALEQAGNLISDDDGRRSR